MFRSGGLARLDRLILVAGIFLLVQPAYAQGKWLKLAPFPQPAEEISGAAAGGKMYVFAGLAPGWKPVGMVYEYDPATNLWHSPNTRERFMPLAASCRPSRDRPHGCRSTMHGNMIPRPTPGKLWLPCPENVVRRWRR